MHKIWLVALRELKERLRSRSFILMAVLGPVLVLGLTYTLFAVGGSQKKHLNVLVFDPEELLNGKIKPKEDPNLSYDFTNTYVEFNQFAAWKDYEKYDVGVEINEKVLKNKTVKVLYREQLSSKVKTQLRFEIERRLEELMVAEFTTLNVKKFREIKQPLNFHFFNTYDPDNSDSNLSGWAGFFFGIVIILFVFLFGMTILRSVSQEKSNRIVEVLLASVSPKTLMVGKVLGIGITALFQFLLWTLIIGLGLYFLRETLFVDILDPANFNVSEMTAEVANQTMQEKLLAARDYNQFVDLVYSKLNFGVILLFFVLFFVGGYLFFGAFFAAIGSSIGSESDGQQFIIPLLLLLALGLFGGYYAIYYPQSGLTELFAFLPFTSPVVMMVKLAQGFSEGESWQIFASLAVLIISAMLMFWIAGKIYKNGILQFGHRLKISHLFKWIKTP